MTYELHSAVAGGRMHERIDRGVLPRQDQRPAQGRGLVLTDNMSVLITHALADVSRAGRVLCDRAGQPMAMDAMAESKAGVASGQMPRRGKPTTCPLEQLPNCARHVLMLANHSTPAGKTGRVALAPRELGCRSMLSATVSKLYPNGKALRSTSPHPRARQHRQGN